MNTNMNTNTVVSIRGEKNFLRMYGNVAALSVVVLSIGLSVSLGSLMYISGDFSLQSFPDTKSLFIPFLLNFFVPYFLLAAILCVVLATTGKARFASMLAFSIALVSVTLESFVFFGQLINVLPQQLGLQAPQAGLECFLFRPGKYLYAIEFLGSSFLSLSAFFLGFAIQKKNIISIWMRRLFFAQAPLFLVIALSPLFPQLWFLFAPVWGITFPPAFFLLAKYFQSGGFEKQ